MVVVACLLTGASDAAHHEEWVDSLLLELLDRATNTGWRHDLLLSTLLTNSLERHPPSAAARQPWLAIGRKLVDARIDEVVGGQDRGAYARVAHLAAACAEAVTLATERDKASDETGPKDHGHGRGIPHAVSGAIRPKPLHATATPGRGQVCTCSTRGCSP